MSEKEIRTIYHCRKSLHFFEEEGWKKKANHDCFDVTMGSYDGAEICEIIGLYILNNLSKILGKNNVGLYRDDGLAVMKTKSGRLVDKTRKEIIKIFKEIGFQIEIDTNLQSVNFLDITFDLTTGTYKPYKKPNDTLLYINTSSSHPNQILKQLPISINKRLSKNFQQSYI